LNLLIKAGEQYINEMIDLVTRNKQQESLTQSLLDYLMGEIDSSPKDLQYLKDFYFIIGNIQGYA